MNLLERADINNIDSGTRKLLKKIERTSDPCQRYAQKPLQFKFTLRDDKDFNDTIYVDIFHIDGKLILHILDKEKYFQTARRFENFHLKQFGRY